MREASVPSPWRLQLGSKRKSTVWLVPDTRLQCVYLTSTGSLIYQNSTVSILPGRRAGTQKWQDT